MRNDYGLVWSDMNVGVDQNSTIQRHAKAQKKRGFRECGKRLILMVPLGSLLVTMT